MVIDFELDFKKELINQEETAFWEFYSQTVDVFYRYLKVNYNFSESDEDDVIEDFYIKCWNAFPSLDLEQSFSGFVWMIFKNVIVDFLKKRVDLNFSDLTMSTTEDDNRDFEENIEDPTQYTEILNIEFENEKILNAMKELDDKSQEIVYLKFVNEKTYQEIAEMLNISIDTVRQRCSRALKILKTNLNSEE